MKTPAARFLSFTLAGIALAAAFGPAQTLLRAQPPEAAGVAVNDNVISFNEDEETKTVDVGGRDVAVNGDGNKLTLRGECRTLTVNGEGNTIEVEIVAAIALPGDDNRVIWAKAAGSAEKPQITILGSGNSVTRRATP